MQKKFVRLSPDDLVRLDCSAALIAQIHSAQSGANNLRPLLPLRGLLIGFCEQNLDTAGRHNNSLLLLRTRVLDSRQSGLIG